MNCLAVCDVLEQKGVPARVMTAMEMHEFAEYYTHERAMKHLKSGKVVRLAAWLHKGDCTVSIEFTWENKMLRSFPSVRDQGAARSKEELSKLPEL